MKDPPSILILTLKRFNNNLSKNNADVKVSPVIDLQGHCLNPGDHLYEIYSMIVHNGTARGGHYTAYSKRGENWYLHPFLPQNTLLITYIFNRYKEICYRKKSKQIMSSINS